MNIRDIFSRVMNLGRTRPPEVGGNTRYIYLPAKKHAGVRVTHDNALTFAAVWACVRTISEDLAKMPWHVYGENKEIQSENFADWVLHKEANEEMTAFSWRETMVSWALTWGDAVSELTRDRAGRVAEMWPISPWRVDIKRTNSGRLVYDIDNGAGQSNTVLTPSEVVHIHGLGPDGITGYSVIGMHARTIGLGLSMVESSTSLHGNNGVPAGIVKYTTKITPEVRKQTRDEWNLLNGGPENRGRIAVLDGDMDFKPITMPMQEAEYIASLQLSVEDVCRIYRVPPHKVQHLLRSTNNNIEQQSIEYVQDTLQPWATRLEQEADRKLLGRNQRGRLYTKINLNSLMRGDAQSRSAFYWQLFQMGVLSPNDIRELEDMGPIGADGDKRLVAVNMTTLDKAGEIEEAAPQDVDNGGEREEDLPVAIANRLNGNGVTNGKH